jgi:hypothetical protein
VAFRSGGVAVQCRCRMNSAPSVEVGGLSGGLKMNFEAGGSNMFKHVFGCRDGIYSVNW